MERSPVKLLFLLLYYLLLRYLPASDNGFRLSIVFRKMRSVVGRFVFDGEMLILNDVQISEPEAVFVSEITLGWVSGVK